MSVLNTLLRAVAAKRRVDLVYKGERRLVEVHTLGVSTAGKDSARVYQVVGGSRFSAHSGWKLLTLSSIEEAIILDDPSSGPRPGYMPSDKAFSAILTEISDVAVPAP